MMEPKELLDNGAKKFLIDGTKTVDDGTKTVWKSSLMMEPKTFTHSKN